MPDLPLGESDPLIDTDHIREVVLHDVTAVHPGDLDACIDALCAEVDRLRLVADLRAEVARLTEQVDDWRTVLFSIGFGQAPAGEEARAALARFPDPGDR